MCDYSLHPVASRPARIEDKLVATKFPNSITRGFAAASCATYGRARAVDVYCSRRAGDQMKSLRESAPAGTAAFIPS